VKGEGVGKATLPTPFIIARPEPFRDAINEVEILPRSDPGQAETSRSGRSLPAGRQAYFKISFFRNFYKKYLSIVILLYLVGTYLKLFAQYHQFHFVQEVHFPMFLSLVPSMKVLFLLYLQNQLLLYLPHSN